MLNSDRLYIFPNYVLTISQILIKNLTIFRNVLLANFTIAFCLFLKSIQIIFLFLDNLAKF